MFGLRDALLETLAPLLRLTIDALNCRSRLISPLATLDTAVGLGSSSFSAPSLRSDDSKVGLSFANSSSIFYRSFPTLSATSSGSSSSRLTGATSDSAAIFGKRRHGGMHSSCCAANTQNDFAQYFHACVQHCSLCRAGKNLRFLKKVFRFFRFLGFNVYAQSHAEHCTQEYHQLKSYTRT